MPSPMIARLRNRLSYANVAATLALVLAAGGSSYAALSLPKNSVGSAQIRSGAVGTHELRNRGVHAIDIAPSTRRSLRGRRGPTGSAGPPAAKFFAAVDSNGVFMRGNATNGGHTVQGSGLYTVGFAQSVSSCVYSATLGTTDGSAAAPGRITVTDVGGRVEVHTFDASGNPADAPFHLIVAC
jgi:hypothetical protein